MTSPVYAIAGGLLFIALVVTVLAVLPSELAPIEARLAGNPFARVLANLPELLAILAFMAIAGFAFAVWRGR